MAAPNTGSSRHARFMATIRRLGKRTKTSLDPPGNTPTTQPVNPASQTVYLRIHKTLLNRHHDSTPVQPVPPPSGPDPDATGHVVVIAANILDLQPFAGDFVNWLIKIAQLLFEPLDAHPEIRLYRPTTHDTQYWQSNDFDPVQWVQVQNGEILRATLYEYRPANNQSVTISKQSLRIGQSTPSDFSANAATLFRHDLLLRDAGSILSGTAVENYIIASHLIPKRLGDGGIGSVMHRFTGITGPVTRFDRRLGVMLAKGVEDTSVDGFEVGFWETGPNQYMLHNFTGLPNLYISVAAGSFGAVQPQVAMVHGYQITLHPLNALIPLPPVGVFNWHYLQCILRKFATDQYRNLPCVSYFNFPFRSIDDEDEDEDWDFDDPRNIENPPYPSYYWDLADWRYAQQQQAEEDKNAIITWRSGLSA